MIDLYKKAFITFILFSLFSLVITYVSLERLYLDNQLLPTEKASIKWKAKARTDAEEGGESSTIINDDKYSLDVDFNVKSNTQYPYASISLIFQDEKGKQRFVDLSRYQSISFTVKCAPNNVLLFAAYTVEKTITKLDDIDTYRTPTTFFSCEEKWKKIHIDITTMKAPQWWLDKFGLELSKQAYKLDKVPRLSIGTTHQSPMNTDANIQVNDLTLHGYDWRYLIALVIALLTLWLGFIFWFFKEHTNAKINDVKEKIYKDRPLIAYQKLSLEPQKDKDKAAILRFMATEYANPDLNLDLTITKLGVSRTKINDVLKEELGFTFTAYLNKLRLTEAARLLSSKEVANVAEIAYFVGYKNVTYFNKLFKNSFGCTPKEFIHIQRK